MVIYRILGITWYLMCCYGALNVIRSPFKYSPQEPLKFQYWPYIIFMFPVFVTGIVASIFVYFYASRWACWVIGFIAAFNAVGALVSEPKTTKAYVSFTISLVSLLLLIGLSLGLRF